MSRVDHLVVGAGTAGCVLAARLSEDPARQVLLLEAGPDFPDEASLPRALLDGDGEGFDAGLTATVCDGRVAGLARGRVVGGSSQVNGRGVLRAPAADFHEWAALGLPEWGWDEVLPSYRRLEADREFGDRPHHGSTGPVPVVRFGSDELSGPMRGFLEAVLGSGHAYRADMNEPDAVGIGPYPRNRRGRVRMSTNLTHLAPARGRPNLTVRAGVRVDRVLLSGDRVVGVEVAGGGGGAGRGGGGGTSGVVGERIEAREVILCAGAPMTPALLLRSGIGPAEELRSAGVAVRVDLPGVGREVHDQPGAVIPALPVPGSVSGTGLSSQLIGRIGDVTGAGNQGERSQADGDPGEGFAGDFYLNLFAGPDPFDGDPVSAVMVGDMRPVAQGTVRLSGPDPAAAPDLDLGFHREESDTARMRALYRHAWEIVHHPSFARTITGVAMVDDALVADDQRLTEALRAMTFSRLTLMGGARMGPDGDPGAVLDQHCRVRGVEGLRVVDLSAVPVRLRSTSALEAMMIGEHAARLMLR